MKDRLEGQSAYGIIDSVDLPSSLTEFLAKARTRTIVHLLLDYLVISAAIALGGAAVILLFGTQVLSWMWLVLIVGISLATGLYLARKRFPSLYAVAQRIDSRMKLSDTLSTAAYFLGSPGTSDPTVRENQRLQAEHVAESVDLKHALPLTRPRALYAAVALAAAVGGIFLLRYAILGSFDPKAPLAQSAFDGLFRPAKQQAKNGGSPADGNQPNDGGEQSKESAKNSDFAGEPTPEQNSQTAANQEQKGQNSKQEGDKDQPGDGKDKGDSKSGDEQSKGNQNEQGDKQDGNQNAKATQDPSLIDKVREALNDMLNKMKSQPNDNSKNQKGDQQSDNEQQPGSDGQAQEKGDSQQAQNGKQSSDAQDGSNSAQNQKSQEPQNGIGSQEGDKAAKQAEALKAMGKITELLGKRAENVKGAVMVEVGSTKQQLKTPLGQSHSTHAEAGSEIHRDEVPPIYEQFVQQYYEKIRKTSSSSANKQP